jgi:hypothetical protein
MLWTSLVDPSTSAKRNVTVPVGSSPIRVAVYGYESAVSEPG